MSNIADPLYGFRTLSALLDACFPESNWIEKNPERVQELKDADAKDDSVVES
jgi:hypothetical protein